MIVACVSVFSGLMYADTDVVIDLSGITQKNASTDVNNGITVTSTRKSQSVTYYTGGQLRFYKGDGLTVNSISDNIVKVTFTSAETSKNTLDGLISDQNGVIASAGNTAQHAEFSVSSPVDQFSFINTAQVRINTMTVTIADGGTVTETVAAPVISPADGSELSEGNNTVTIGCDTEGATVYYTIDGSVPTVESDMYSAPFQLTSSATVKAMAVKDGMNNSPVSSVTYVYRVQGVFSLVTSEDELVAGDMYIIAAAEFDMAMGNAVKKNNRPAVAAVKFGNNIENPSDQVAWVQLVRQDAGWALKVTNGDLSGQYLYNPVNDKNYLEGATEIKAVATIVVSDAGVATVKFTTNISKNWIRYNSSGDLFSCYGSGQSDIALYRKVSETSAVATPVIVADDENNVTISCETEGALLYYTIDGSAPTDRSIPYQPFSVDRTTTVKAIAYLGEESSAVATLEVKVPEMMSLAEFLDQKPADKVRVNGPLTVIYQNGDYMYVTDGQGSNVLCFGAVDDVYVNGNTLQYLYGRYDEFKGLPELAGPVCGPRGEDAGEVEPQTVTSLADMSRYALNSYLTLGAVGISGVKENNAVFTDSDGNTYNAYLNSNYGVAYPDDQTVRYYVTGFTSVYSNGKDVSLQFTPVSFVDEGTATGIVEISSDNDAECETVWFTIGGVRVESPTVSGVYVRVQGSRAEKVIL
ncbi:hypothetical protein IMSAGC006_00170 [Muribaculaceae bacterium]|nr:hypothetical protein IMSAGC006_00170 [Muribaculaceae bacterium]